RCSQNYSIVSDWSASIDVVITDQIHNVKTPNTPTGPSSAQKNQTVTFSTGGSNCNQGHSVQYRFDWGDGSSYSSWGSSTRSHSFSANGTYSVKAQARCATDNSIVSNWSEGKTITISNGNAAPIDPVTQANQHAGSEFEVVIYVGSSNEQVNDLFGVSFELRYTQTDYLEYVSYDKNNSFLGSNLLDYITPDDANGKIAIALSRRGTSTGVSGKGELIKIKFRTNSSTPGGTIINFSIHDVSANDPQGNSINLTPGSATTEILSGINVWPGDTNNDGKVDQADILPIGLYWEKTGLARTCHSNEIQWIAHTANPWNPEKATYADANGDGTVNQGDVLPVGLNWGKTHTMLKITYDNDGKGIDGYLTPIVNDHVNNNEFYVDIQVSGVENLHGISFKFNFPIEYLEVLSIEQQDFLGNDVVYYDNVDNTNGNVGIGISKKGSQNGSSGHGQIVSIKLLEKPNSPVGISMSLSLTEVVANDNEGNTLNIQGQETTYTVTAVEINQSDIAQPDKFELFKNYPNPFNPTTTIRYSIVEKDMIQLKIFDIKGRLVKTLISTEQQQGIYTVEWNATDEAGNPVASGIYLYQLTAGKRVKTCKMVLNR
ncbi:MAG: T9SS type A sorting domain-containing protein, partial [Candidatus Lokiarchaeota archaeon]|nr:T9SS type A sorting domain-containing protein [Candidatus Lokiarchaeota archaeon]